MARKEKNIHYIYKTTCNVTGRYYVGMHSTSNLEDGYMGSGKILRYSIRKYGKENHTKEILEFYPTREELAKREREIVDKIFINEKLCMNLAIGGEGGHGSKFLSKEQLQKGGLKSGEIHKNKLATDIDYFKKISQTSSKNISSLIKLGKIKPFNWKGHPHSEESKQKMSESSKGMGVGETNSQFGTCWITKDGINKKIKKEDLETYLNEGWVQGRKIIC